MKQKSPRHLVTLAFIGSILGAAALFGPQAVSQVVPVAAPTVSTPAPKPNAQAIQDLKNQVPLDLSKLQEPLPRNLWVELSKLVNPAVVAITTTSTPREMRGARDPLQDFFDQFYGGGAPGGAQRRGRPEAAPAMALGTGFIIREDGLIITNNHVVEQAEVIKVQLNDTSDKLYEARVIGRDSKTDIALIKIDAKEKLPVAKLGESKNVQVGEYVAAFGNPYGHAHTMTTGIVSALGREIAEINRFPFIQTDASINPGNSGGPLINVQGYVIGVNTAIDARAQGIGFAIPIDNVKQIVAQLEKDGRVHRGYLGVGIAEVDDNVASQLGMTEPHGVLVTQVFDGSPAQKAGIQPYDIIMDVNGKKTDDAAVLSNTVSDIAIGSDAKVRYWRFDENGKHRELTASVKVADAPDMTRPAPARKSYFGQKAPFDLGFNVANFTPEIARDLNIEAQVRGPIVTTVTPKSAAALAGLRAGDIVVDINRRATPKATDVLRLLKKGRNLVRVARGESLVILSIGN